MGQLLGKPVAANRLRSPGNLATSQATDPLTNVLIWPVLSRPIIRQAKRPGVEGAGAPGLLSYNLSSVSRADLERIERLQRAHYREIVNIVAESAPSECVVLYAVQLLALSAG